jgi:hypothetical protein
MPFDPSLDSARTTFQMLSIVSWAVGGAAAVAGGVLMVLWYRGSPAESPRPVTLVPSVAPGAAALTLGGSF